MIYLSDDNILETRDYLKHGKVVTFQLGNLFIYQKLREPNVFTFSIGTQHVIYSAINNSPKILATYTPF